MLRVLVFTTTLIRQGPTNVMYNMIKAAKRNNSDIDFRILTLSKEDPDSRKDEFLGLGIPVDTMGYSDGYYSIFHIKEIKEKIRDINPNILHSYCFRPDIIASFMNLHGIVKISSLWNYPYDDYCVLFGKLKGSLMAWLHIRRLNHFNTVVVCSNFISDKLRKYRIPINIIYTGVDTDYFCPISTELRNQERGKLGITPNDKVFIYIANLISRKNPLFLISAFANYNDEHAKLLVMGDGPLMKACVKAAGNDKRIIFLGRRKGTLDDIRLSDFYVSTSNSEGFPTAVLESASVGLKPILSAIKPHLELVSVDPNYLSFNLESNVELYSCIDKACNMEPSFDYRNLVVKYFSDNQMYLNYKNLYKLVSGDIYIE